MTAPIAPATDTPPEVAQAEAEAHEADELLAALEERVRDGDDKVTPQQLAEQRELSGFAKLRAEAQDKRRAELVDQAAALADGAGNPAPVAAAYDKATAAIAELVAAVGQHDQAVTEAGRLLREAGCGPLVEYTQVDHGEYVTSEPHHAQASRTAPRVDPAAPAFSFGQGSRHTIGAGPLLSVLLDQVTAGDAAPMPQGQPHLTAAPIREHANRHRDQVRAFLDRANTTKEK
ncbi:hypothetical protein ACFW2X_02200 [Streptomyces antibioticus]|uniref:hypothetical protein n=1 Tax=Streptomyces antibioticus TaxID=1890 RepID=UPI00368E9945